MGQARLRAGRAVMAFRDLREGLVSHIDVDVSESQQLLNVLAVCSAAKVSYQVQFCRDSRDVEVFRVSLLVPLGDAP